MLTLITKECTQKKKKRRKKNKSTQKLFTVLLDWSQKVKVRLKTMKIIGLSLLFAKRGDNCIFYKNLFKLLLYNIHSNHKDIGFKNNSTSSFRFFLLSSLFLFKRHTTSQRRQAKAYRKIILQPISSLHV